MATNINVMMAATVANNRMRFISFPFKKGGTRQPRQLANVATLASGDEFPMNSWLTSENNPYRESVNKGKEKGRGEKPQP
jgi:hypothetical protein